MRASSALLYERDRVRDLAARPVAGCTEVAAVCPDGLFLARRAVDACRSAEERRAALQQGWAFSPFTAVLIRLEVEQHGSLPFVATVSGFVTTGAELMGREWVVRGWQPHAQGHRQWGTMAS